MSDLPLGVFGGSIEGQANGSFVLVTRVVSEGWAVQGHLFYGIDTIAPAISGLVLFRDWISCSSNDRRARNGTDLTFVAGREMPDAAPMYVNATLKPLVPLATGTLRALDGEQATRRFTGGPIPGSIYETLARPEIPDVSGAWTLHDPKGAPVTLTISADGTLTGTYGQCSLAGRVEPAREGPNYFYVWVRATGCRLGQIEWPSDFDGFIVAIPFSAGGKQLLFWAENNNGVDWAYMAAVGTSPAPR